MSKTMSNANANPGVIPFELSFDLTKDMRKVKHNQCHVDNNGEIQKTMIELPIMPMNGTKAMLLHDDIDEFVKASLSINWTTGPSLYGQFTKHLD